MFLNGTPGIDRGLIVSHSGNMFGGKSTALHSAVDQMTRIEFIRKKKSDKEQTLHKPLVIGAFKPCVDVRYSEDEIVTHNGNRIKCTPVKNVEELINTVNRIDYRIVVIDEVQFFNEKNENKEYYEITYALTEFANQNRLVIVAGLDKDFRGLPFGPMGEILAISDEKHSYPSVCVSCGSPATLPQRIINGEPAKFNDPIVMLGSVESYEPRCRKCHEVNIDNVETKE